MEKIVVSLTSYPARMNTLHKVLDTLVQQTRVPDKIVLYLADRQFPDRKLPAELLSYERYGFEVHWQQEDLGPHKKYFYAMQEYPDDIIITVDDDFLYKQTLIDELLAGYAKFSYALIARRGAIVTCQGDGTVAPYFQWYGKYIKPVSYINVPRMDIFATTGGGTLFPPGLFKKEIFNMESILENCGYADDIWIKVMQLINNVPTVLVNAVFDDVPMEDYEGEGLYAEYNKGGGNDRQLCNLLRKYSVDYKGENKLTDMLFADGRLYAADVDDIFKSVALNKVDEFIQSVLGYEQIVIYGAGIVARRVYEALRRTDSYKKVVAFVVNDEKDNPSEFMGRCVKNYREYIGNDNVAYIVGLTDAKQEAVAHDLYREGISEERIIKLDKVINVALSALWSGQ